MTEVGASRRPYTIGANLRWFAFMYILVLLAISGLANVASTYIPSIGILGGVLSFSVAAYTAATRFAEKRNDVPQKRGLLSISYATLALSIAWSVPITVILFRVFGMRHGDEEHSFFSAILSALVFSAISFPVNCFIAWLALGRAASIREKS